MRCGGLTRAALAVAVVLGGAACGPGPKPPELVSFEQMWQAENAAVVAERYPKLFDRADRERKRALEAHEDGDEDETQHHTRMATIVWRTGVALSQKMDHEDSLRAAQNRLKAAEEQLEEARRRKANAEDAIARQQRINQMQAQLAAEKRAGQVKAMIDAAAARLKEAESMNAAQHAAGELNKARAGLELAFEAFNRAGYQEAEQAARLAMNDAEAAIATSRPFWQAQTAFEKMMVAVASVPGADARIERRGLVITMRSLFDGKKTTIKAEQTFPAQLVAKLAKEYPDFRLVVEGHTDNRGGAKANLKLSEQRAAAVATFLGNQGVDGTRITALGKGDHEPIADNSKRDGRAQNQRVEIVFLRPAPQ